MSWAELLLFAAPGLPLALAALSLASRLRPALFGLLRLAPVPALAAALLLEAGMVRPLPGALLGAGLAVTATGQLFLAVAALLWLLAGWFARAAIAPEVRGGFAGWWLATLGGNMLLFLAGDVVTFYLAFALLSLAGFGLVIHSRSEEALRAARVYLALAVVGETCLLLGLLLAAQAADSTLVVNIARALAGAPYRDLAIALLVAGFGIKAGLMPLHVWLPLAHPAAPVPASAVLSGAIVKAGIFGLLTFLPLQAALPGWSGTLIALGLATAYLGVIFGLCQTRPKTVLAYSTLSQMGLLVAVLGVGLGEASASAIAAAVAFYAAHHGLAKGALFLSVGVIAQSGRRWSPAVLGIAALLALAVAGLPLTGGALAKLAIKGPLGDGLAALLIGLSAIGTTLLMLRFLQLARASLPEKEKAGRPPLTMLLPYVACAVAAIALPWALFPRLAGATVTYAMAVASLWSAAWPVLLGAALLALWLRWPARPAMAVPEGDLIVPARRIAGYVAAMVRHMQPGRFALPDLSLLHRLGSGLAGVERQLARWPVAGAAMLSLAAAIFAAAVR